MKEILIFARRFSLLVLLPSFFAIAAAEWIGWRTGGTMLPSSIALAQQRDPMLIWAGELRHYAPFKLASIALQQPDIVFVGTSRCAEMRSGMFKPYRFYNACVTSGSFDQIRMNIERILDVSHPKIVIITLDYFMFTDGFAAGVTEKMTMEYDYSMRSHLDGLVSLGTAIRNYPLTMAKYLFVRKREPIDGMELLGLPAIRGNAGFRYDGSLLYDPNDRIASVVHNQDVKFGLLSQFHGGPEMRPDPIAALKRLADAVHARGAVLVGMQMPILKSTVDYLDTETSYWSYAGVWRDFESAKARDLFAELGIRFFDMSRDDVCADPRNFFDSGHPTERGNLGAFVHELDNPEFRAAFPDLDAAQLRADYARAQQDDAFFDLYHDRF